MARGRVPSRDDAHRIPSLRPRQTSSTVIATATSQSTDSSSASFTGSPSPTPQTSSPPPPTTTSMSSEPPPPSTTDSSTSSSSGSASSSTPSPTTTASPTSSSTSNTESSSVPPTTSTSSSIPTSSSATDSTQSTTSQISTLTSPTPTPTPQQSSEAPSNPVSVPPTTPPNPSGLVQSAPNESITTIISSITTTINGQLTTVTTGLPTIVPAPDSSSSSASRTAGIVAGAVVGTALLLAIIGGAFLLRRHRAKSHRRQSQLGLFPPAPRPMLDTESFDLAATDEFGGVVAQEPPPRLLRARGSHTGSIFQEGGVWPPPGPGSRLEDPLLSGGALGDEVFLAAAGTDGRPPRILGSRGSDSSPGLRSSMASTSTPGRARPPRELPPSSFPSSSNLGMGTMESGSSVAPLLSPVPPPPGPHLMIANPTPDASTSGNAKGGYFAFPRGTSYAHTPAEPEMREVPPLYHMIRRSTGEVVRVRRDGRVEIPHEGDVAEDDVGEGTSGAGHDTAPPRVPPKGT